ncbi:hypothetical protein L873DRAFT_1673364, partial [Choiromyces venosus 120613-1]
LQRKIFGTKLGGVVRRDIFRHAQPNSKSPSALKDKRVEINLQGKSLCDESIKLICEALIENLEAGYIHLDELNLAENDITVAGLQYLCGVVRLASKDLKDLDLRSNEIGVNSEKDADIWEDFLDSGLRFVSSLRRLDLSKNRIEDRGIEIFAKVYSRELPLVLPRLSRSTLLESSDEEWDVNAESDQDELDPPLYSQVKPTQLSKTPTASPSSFLSNSKSNISYSVGSFNRQSSDISATSGGVELHGIRSIPYLILTQTSMTDKAALFLSYVVPVHPLPENLLKYLPPTRPGIQTETLQTYDTTSGCQGIIFQPNRNFTQLGLKALELANALRTGTPSGNHNASRGRRFSDVSLPLITPMKHKRESVGSCYSSHISPVTGTFTSELERVRGKIQGMLLKDEGVCAVEQWSVAVKMLSICRAILFKGEPVTPELDPLPPQTPLRDPAGESGYSSLGLPPYGPSLTNRTDPPSPISEFQKLSLSILPEGWIGISSQNSQEIMDPPHASLCSTPLEQVPESSRVTSCNAGPLKKALPGSLEQDTWMEIIAFAVDPKGILSEKQRLNIVEWARSSETLAREKELSGKTKAVQIWRLLEGIECLGFDV